MVCLLFLGIDQSVASATNKQTSSLISIKPIPNVMPLMRIGHASMIIGDVIITIGGFGEEGGKHQRLSSVTVTDIKSFNSKVLHLEVDLKTTESKSKILSYPKAKNQLLRKQKKIFISD